MGQPKFFRYPRLVLLLAAKSDDDILPLYAWVMSLSLCPWERWGEVGGGQLHEPVHRFLHVFLPTVLSPYGYPPPHVFPPTEPPASGVRLMIYLKV